MQGRRILTLTAALAASLALAACTDGPAGDPLDDAGAGGGAGGGGGGGGGATEDAGADEPCEGPPGLFADDACDELAEGVVPYAPRFPLWTDGAAKERYIALPPGTRIDASNPDGWIYPVGTRLWKTFVVDGKRVETRMLEKVQEGDGIAAWSYVAYAWDEAQRSVEPAPAGVRDALGTDHDIPSMNDCAQCHASVEKDMVLGFSAIQLNHEDAGVDLAAMNAGGWFEDGQSIPVEDADVPGDEVAVAALGYLHANCGHCHGTGGLVAPPAGLSMRLRVGDATVEETDAFITAVDVPAFWQTPPPESAYLDRIEPGRLEDSAILRRFELGEMPLIGTDVVDPAGVSAIGAWITALDE